MLKKFLSTLSILVFSTIFAVSVSAAPERPAAPITPETTELPKLPDLPSKSGLYSDPENSLVRVQVYVHREKPAATQQSILVCNLEDPDSTATVSAEAWHLPSSVTYSLNVGSVPSSVGSSNLPTIVNNGFSDWISASGNKVAFIKGSNTTKDKSSLDFKNIISWGRASNGTLGVTYIRYYTQTGVVADVDTIMNKRYPWSWSNSSTCADTNSFDAENIIEHELGHWLGLDDEYDGASFQNATMYGYGSKGEVKKNTLSTGDINGVFGIYNP
ncbi:hypothetical protein A3F00_01820 [Candidatus Daviesbacteria bacterium RIFCSPHIGHO2_12_FULL_37_11]|uniref:Peptidase M10 metallopeptidase domain-containing protein n=1 Tax=Candidatus Daviesbacteria bacterium RIFCSPHIGHO2_12_FULL_37_11 TaxID=1797777 RepID=A0A1F5KDH6_9BACT|nr:MAG: hypothetical protein A3F00_01820 [Candidatus Daviesbacteria bacterium RIFCSPHIGHO2_12_FULL_37_11]OGE45568.1 MAG: hypothetical protein A3B39_05165 [Candidatus Daviesbacteria bacterium RIFCSPLOWO2_01_FULL_37_10]